MSCLEVTFRRIGGLNAACRRTGQLSCAFGLVCETDLGEDVLWAADMMVLTVDGEKVYLTKTND